MLRTLSPIWGRIRFNCQFHCGKFHFKKIRNVSVKLLKKVSFFLLLTRFPFDTNKPMGYLIAVIFEYIVFGYEYFLDACTLALGIGAYWFVIALIKEIQHILQSINEKAQANLNQSEVLMVLFTEFIDIHEIVKQLSV